MRGTRIIDPPRAAAAPGATSTTTAGGAGAVRSSLLRFFFWFLDGSRASLLLPLVPSLGDASVEIGWKS